MNRLLIALTLLALLMPASGVHAQQKDSATEAKTQFKAGQEFFKEGSYVDALRAFKKAHRLHPHPDIVFMVGQAQRNLKLHAAAINSFKSYLDGKPDAEDREDVERLIEELDFLEEAEGSAEDPTAADDEKAEQAAAAAKEEERKKKARALPTPAKQDAPHALTPTNKEKPIYKKAWFWAAVGGGLVVVGGAAGIIAWQASGTDAPEGSLGTFDIP